MIHWLILIMAGLCEIGFTSCLGKAQQEAGHTAIYWYGGFIFFISASMFLLMKAIHYIPIGTAYAVWTGIGAAGSVIVGILVFKEPATFWRLFFLTTLIGSVIGLKAVSH